MSRRDDRPGRRKLALRRETVRALSDIDLTRVAGGTWTETWDCETRGSETWVGDTEVCGYSAGSRYC